MNPITATVSEGFLWASLVWGAVGSGYLVYGWRQKSLGAFLAGLALIVVSYVVSSWWVMSLIALAIIGLTVWLYRRGIF
ncbi:MAG TPA: hypothetical protein VMB21_20705 [Candidatus Limnocylindria bacterium]|jgi:hypothetical protein|nr:hypothetical protein [Candidatus Limnocylindria bacterium]